MTAHSHAKFLEGESRRFQLIPFVSQTSVVGDWASHLAGVGVRRCVRFKIEKLEEEVCALSFAQ